MLYSMVKGPLTIAADASGSVAECGGIITEAIAEYGPKPPVQKRNVGNYFPVAVENKRGSTGVYGVLNQLYS